MSASAPRSAPKPSRAGKSPTVGVGEAHNATQPAKPEVLSPEWWVYFRDLGNRMVTEACQFDVYCSAGAVDELEYYGGTT